MPASDAILVVNAGSSSLKFQLFDLNSGGIARRLKGQIDGIGTRPRLRATDAGGATLIDEACSAADIPDLSAAITRTRGWLGTVTDVALRAIGHRVVHGGPDFAHPVLIDDVVLDRLEALVNLAPLHQPGNLAPIRQLRANDLTIPQVACFDTAFHRGHPAHADHYALPRSFYDQGIRRYGFHGLSYEYVAQAIPAMAPGLAPSLAGARVIVAHLGSGASMCALSNGHSIESTMGFTALDGLPMGTRPGQVDPGVVLYLIGQMGMSVAEVSELLYRNSGLKGLSGISNDMRDLLDSPDPRAAFAIDHFIHRATLTVGQLTAALGGLDGIVFTAGVGENAPAIRAAIAGRLGWLGVELDPDANAIAATTISTPASRVSLHIIPTDEELMIARHTVALLGL